MHHFTYVMWSRMNGATELLTLKVKIVVFLSSVEDVFKTR